MIVYGLESKWDTSESPRRITLSTIEATTNKTVKENLMKPGKQSTRRQFMRHGAGALIAIPIAIPVALGLGARSALAGEQLDAADPTAQALGYVHDAATSDKRIDTSAMCGKCQLYTGPDGTEWGPCALFPGKDVNAAGWCTAWVAKAG